MTTPATSDHALPVRVSERDDLERVIDRAAPDSALAAHARAVAETVDGLGVGEEATLAAGLYPLWRHHRIAPDTAADSRQERLLDLLRGVDQLAVIDELAAPGGEAEGRARAERLRQMLLALVEDARVVVIKLADHLEGLREAKAFPREEQIRVARETFDIYAPLANRLGIWQLKWQLEDLALRYLEPETYHQIASWLAERRSERERRIGAIVEQLERELRAHGIDAEVTGRPKNIFSIWQKVRNKNLSFESVFDVRAVRVVVPDVASCYAVVGIIHRRWPPVPGQFDDYIANPKENLYQSLHTAVVGPDGHTVEVQIRTREMHEHAELGIAAHWRYKEGSTSDRGIERKVRWLRTLLEAPEGETSDDLLERFRSEILAEHVYVLTPRGEVIDLPRGATPVDFAYAIHTEVGHRCRGARVNGRIASLARPLESGDRVEILTARDGGPSRDWLVPQLGYLGTARARERVRQWFRQQPREDAVTAGRALLQRELQRLGLADASYDELAGELGYRSVEDFLAAIGRGDVTIDQVTARLRAVRGPEETPAGATGPGRQSADIEVEGAGNMLPTVARCCRPAPPDEIVGYITRSRGVTVHRSDCRNALRLASQAPERMIEVSWGRSPSQRYPVEIRVRAHDRSGLLRDITQVMTNEGINLLGASTRTDPRSRVAVMDLTCEIADIPQLSRVLNRISQLPNIQAAHRRV